MNCVGLIVLQKLCHIRQLGLLVVAVLALIAGNPGEALDNNPEWTNENTPTLEEIISQKLAWLNSGLDTPSGRIIRVGPGREYATPADAAKHVRDGAEVIIDAGVYHDQEAKWKANNITIRAIDGRAHMKAPEQIMNGKAIWVISGDNVVVKNIEFSGARVKSRNGAGIRGAGVNLAIENCYFHNNENGILVGRKKGSVVLVENSEFFQNGSSDGRAHNIYLGAVDALIFRFNYSHEAYIGHGLKSRARENYILYNKIVDEANGKSSYALDFPSGGQVYMVGNLIQQGANAENFSIVAFNMEKSLYSKKSLIAVNNTMVNDNKGGMFFMRRSDSELILVNNLFVGAGSLTKGQVSSRGNIGPVVSEEFVAREEFDYRLKKGAKAVDAAVFPVIVQGLSMAPRYEYKDTDVSGPRRTVGYLDVGALEYMSVSAPESTPVISPNL